MRLMTKPRQPNEIIIHCSATRPEWMTAAPLQDKVAEIDRWHKARGFTGFGYHWIIDRDGSRMAGRPEEQVGAHTKNRNANSIGICMVGGLNSSANDQFADNYTPEQDAALRGLIADIKVRHPIKKVSGHNDYDAGKACPGFHVGRWLEGKGERGLIESRTMLGQAAAAGGTVGVASIEALAPIFTEAAQQIEPMTAWSPTLKLVFITLTMAGIALTVYARMDDWRRGRK